VLSYQEIGGNFDKDLVFHCKWFNTFNLTCFITLWTLFFHRVSW
jgi:hypothetical protein